MISSCIFISCLETFVRLYVISVLYVLCFCERLFIDALWERTDLMALVCDVCHFSIGILAQMCCLIVSIPDLCPFYYFVQYEHLQKDIYINNEKMTHT